MSANEVTFGGDALSTLLAALHGMQQELARLTAANTEMSERLAKLTEKVEPRHTETKAERRARLEPQAIALLMDPEMQLMQSRIADRLGVSESTLHSWTEFRRILGIAKEQAKAGGKAKYAPHEWPTDDLE
jgi:DNA-binding transcriptional regulator YiaG